MRSKGHFAVHSLVAFHAVALSLLLTACGSGGDGGTSASTNASATPADPAYVTTSAAQASSDCTPKQVVSAGGYSSCNLQWLGRLPIPGTTIGGHLVNGVYFVSNFLNGFYAFDATNAENPKQISNLRIDQANIPAGTTVSAVENEDTATNGSIAILSRTPMQDAVVIDNSDPTKMKIIATVPGGSAHTMTCLENCKWAYGSTTGIIIDLRDPTKPVLLKNKWSDVTGGAKAHDLTEITPGLVAVSSNPVSFLDTTNPANPKLLFNLPTAKAAPANAVVGPAQDGPIGHNNIWPRQGQDRFFMALSEGAYPGRCETYGNDGRSLYLYDTTDWQINKTFKLLSRYTLVTGGTDNIAGGGVEGVDLNGNPSTLELGLQGCSVHWFDSHPNFNNGGLVAMASFSHGMRLLNVTPQGQFQQLGYFIPSGVASTVAVHWITDRVMYVLDFLNGYMDVVKYTGPL